MKKLFEQWEIKKFLEPFEGEKVSVYVLTLNGLDVELSDATVKYTDDVIKFKNSNCKITIVLKQIKSLEIDETEEIARVKAKIEDGTFVKFTYKNL